MKFYITLFITLITLTFFSCENLDNSVSLTENEEIISSNTTNPTIISTENGFEILQLINGTKGGSITFDTVYVDKEGDSILIQTNLTFLPNSFTGVKEIKIIPDFYTGEVIFLPEMIFDKPAFLNLSYTGIDLVRLGFDSNSKVDFVYCTDDGAVELIAKKECKIKWDSKEMYVKNAKLQHFSRYVFVR